MCIERLPAWSIHLHKSTGDAGTRTRVALIDCRIGRGGPTFVVAQGFQSWIEEFELQRFHVIARTLNARLVVVEVPGFGVAGSRLLACERRALLLNGDFGPLATRLSAAVDAVLDGEQDRTLSFLGYSMGASVATAMARVARARGWSSDNLVLVEPVALQRWKIRRLIAATLREDRWIVDYVATNEAIEGAVAPWNQRPGVRPPTRRYLDLLLLGSALRKGAIAGDLGLVMPRRLVVVRGDRSALSDADYLPVLTALRLQGIVTDELIVPGHHAFWHSLTAVTDMSRELKATLDIST